VVHKSGPRRDAKWPAKINRKIYHIENVYQLTDDHLEAVSSAAGINPDISMLV